MDLTPLETLGGAQTLLQRAKETLAEAMFANADAKESMTIAEKHIEAAMGDLLKLQYATLYAFNRIKDQDPVSIRTVADLMAASDMAILDWRNEERARELSGRRIDEEVADKHNLATAVEQLVAHFGDRDQVCPTYEVFTGNGWVKGCVNDQTKDAIRFGERILDELRKKGDTW